MHRPSGVFCAIASIAALLSPRAHGGVPDVALPLTAASHTSPPAIRLVWTNVCSPTDVWRTTDMTVSLAPLESNVTASPPQNAYTTRVENANAFYKINVRLGK